MKIRRKNYVLDKKKTSQSRFARQGRVAARRQA